MKKIIITIFLISIAITAGCLSKESVSSTPTTSESSGGGAKPTPVLAGAAAIASANSAAASTGTIIEDSKLLSRWGPLFSVNNIPPKIKVPESDNLYVINFKVNENEIGGDVLNTGTNTETMTVVITFVTTEGYSSVMSEISPRFLPSLSEKEKGMSGYTGDNAIKQGEQKHFVVLPEEAKIIIQNAKYFKFEHS